MRLQPHKDWPWGCVCVSLCVSVCVNVRGKSPVSLGPGETMAIHTVCYSFGRSCGGGVGGLELSVGDG